MEMQSITNTRSERFANSVLGITLWKRSYVRLAWQKWCQKCNGRNQFATVCKKGQKHDVHGFSEQPELDSDQYVDSCESSYYEFLTVIAAMQLEMMINDKKIKFQIDCWALINIITKCNTTGSHITPSNKTLNTWNGTEMKPLGTTRLKVTNPRTGNKYSIEFVFVSDDLTPLLGAHTVRHNKWGW